MIIKLQKLHEGMQGCHAWLHVSTCFSDLVVTTGAGQHVCECTWAHVFALCVYCPVRSAAWLVFHVTFSAASRRKSWLAKSLSMWWWGPGLEGGGGYPAKQQARHACQAVLWLKCWRGLRVRNRANGNKIKWGWANPELKARKLRKHIIVQLQCN